MPIIVINATTREPGAGFFELAVTLGKISAGLTQSGRAAFWEAEVERVFAATGPSGAQKMLLAPSRKSCQIPDLTSTKL